LKYTPGTAATGFLLFAGLALFLDSSPAAAQPVRSLTAEQVDCEATQLRLMLGRSAILFGPAYDERSAMFLFTYGSTDGNLSGMALMEQQDLTGAEAGPERMFAFAVEPSSTKLIRNPAKPQANTLYLVRDRLSSDLARLKDAHAMAVVVDPTWDPMNNENPFSLLIINNLTDQEGGTAGDAKIGRGLLSILSRCPHTLTAADIHVFSVLSRTLRFAAWDAENPGEQVHKLVSIYRGAAADPIAGGTRASYRVDVLPVQPNKDLGRMSLEVLVDLADDGTLGEASLRVLPACTASGDLHCSTTVNRVEASVIRPVASNQTWSEPAPAVCWKGKANCASESSFSFAERLEGTSWLRP
jgi:hypothetical protein